MRLLRRGQPTIATGDTGDPDARLVAWARRDPQAFTALYDRYFDAVYSYCLRQLGESEAAEDAASETFLKALVALPRYDEVGRFRPWLFAIAHNTVLDAIERRRDTDSLDAAAAIVDPA